MDPEAADRSVAAVANVQVAAVIAEREVRREETRGLLATDQRGCGRSGQSQAATFLGNGKRGNKHSVLSDCA